ncbi:MAG: glucuronidase [Herbinix sp.]|nr:glucuronidase [Herbinix sp.]
MRLSEQDRIWVGDTCQRMLDKMEVSIHRSEGKIPYSTDQNGMYDDKSADKDLMWWTNGFWEGMLWLMYAQTGDDYYKKLGNQMEDILDRLLLGTTDYGIDPIHHDAGFMWLHSSVANYRLTGNLRSRTRGLIAANYLSSRFNIKGNYIVAWDGIERQGWSIIDSMMNIPLLYWAAKETGYDRYRSVAMAHADKTLEHVLRPDGSVIHIIHYHEETGEVIESFGGQGYEVGSSWTRGQAWAIYGFALSYLRTREQRYLDAAKRVAQYFLSALAPFEYVPPVDFRSPKEPIYIDTTAGAIAACGLLEIEKHVSEFEKDMYLSGALKILRALTETQCNFNKETDSILQNGSEAYHTNKHLSIIYGDYFYMEAMLRLNGLDIEMW